MRINYLVAFLCVLGIAAMRQYWLVETMELEPAKESLWIASKTGISELIDVWKGIPSSLWTLLVIRLLKGSLMPFFGIYITLYVLDIIGLNAFEWGIVGSIYMVLGIFLGIPLGKLIDRIGNWNGMLLSFLFSVPFIILLAGAKGFPFLIGLYIIRAIGQLLWYPALSAAQAEMIPAQKRGRILGLSELMSEAITIISSILIAFLYTLAPVNAFYFAFTVEALSIALIMFQIKRT